MNNKSREDIKKLGTITEDELIKTDKLIAAMDKEFRILAQKHKREIAKVWNELFKIAERGGSEYCDDFFYDESRKRRNLK